MSECRCNHFGKLSPLVIKNLAGDILTIRWHANIISSFIHSFIHVHWFTLSSVIVDGYFLFMVGFSEWICHTKYKSHLKVKKPFMSHSHTRILTKGGGGGALLPCYSSAPPLRNSFTSSEKFFHLPCKLLHLPWHRSHDRWIQNSIQVS